MSVVESERFLSIPKSSTVGAGVYPYAVRLRGVPWSATAGEVSEFLGLREEDEERIILVHNASGDGYARAKSSEEATGFRALDGMKFDQSMKKTIEIYEATGEEADSMAELNAKRPDGGYRGVVRLWKLPEKAKNSAATIVRDILEKKVDENEVSLAYLSDDDSLLREMHYGAEAYAVFTNEDLAEEMAKKAKTQSGIEAAVTTRGELYSAEHWAKMRAEGRQLDLTSTEPGILRVRGLPFESTRAMVSEFFIHEKITEEQVFFPNARSSDGRPTGECFVVFHQGKAFALEIAKAKDGQEIGGRWLELYESNPTELANRCKAALRAAARPDASEKGVLRLRGLPFQATLSDIARLIEAASEATRYAFELRQPSKFSIYISGDGARRPTGESFVLLQGGAQEAEAAAAALNGASLGDRLVTALASAKAELFTSLGDDTLYSKCILIRSLPFTYCDFNIDPHHQKLIDDFFAPELVDKIETLFLCRAPNSSWRATGDAYAKFTDNDAVLSALALNRSHLAGRFLELYPCSRSEFESNLARSKEQAAAIAAGGGPPDAPPGGGRSASGRSGRGRGHHHGGGGGGNHSSSYYAGQQQYPPSGGRGRGGYGDRYAPSHY